MIPKVRTNGSMRGKAHATKAYDLITKKILVILTSMQRKQ